MISLDRIRIGTMCSSRCISPGIENLHYGEASIRTGMNPLECLRSMIETHAPLVIALSGGTDSMTLLALAAETGVRVAAVTVENGLNPAGEVKQAMEFAQKNGIRHEVLTSDAFSIPEVAANTPERCYVCKQTMMEIVQDWAGKHGFRTVADGTHADDDPDDRPGMRALRERGIISPFAACGIGRSDIASYARERGIPVLPSSSCLATRFPVGAAVTSGEVERVRKAEALLRPEVNGRLRVRAVDGSAVIEVEDSACAALIPWIDVIMALGFTAVRVVAPPQKGGE
jgi:uncharacterized protein